MGIFAQVIMTAQFWRAPYDANQTGLLSHKRLRGNSQHLSDHFRLFVYFKHLLIYMISFFALVQNSKPIYNSLKSFRIHRLIHKKLYNNFFLYYILSYKNPPYTQHIRIIIKDFPCFVLKIYRKNHFFKGFSSCSDSSGIQ